MRLNKLPLRQEETLFLLHKMQTPVSFRQLAGLLYIKSTATVSKHLNALEKKNFIVKQKGIANSVKITDLGLLYIDEYLQ